MQRVKYGVTALVLSAILFIIIQSSPGQEPDNNPMEGYAEALEPRACEACHRDVHQAFVKENPHYATLLKAETPPDRKGCESCHGPGMRHINSGGKRSLIFSFKDRPLRERSDVCLKCHQEHKEFFQFERSEHKLNAVGCTDCHRVHGSPPVVRLLKAKEPDLCFSCHGEVKFKFLLPTHHKVLEGALLCSDCHTPHGSRTRPSLRRWNKFNIDVCFKCHPEKRGPWVFEHPSVKVEGCSICHDPHGSPNRYLLTHSNSRRVCIQCHGLRHQGSLIRSTEICTNCHTQVHGSNFSSRFFH